MSSKRKKRLTPGKKSIICSILSNLSLFAVPFVGFFDLPGIFYPILIFSYVIWLSLTLHYGKMAINTSYDKRRGLRGIDLLFLPYLLGLIALIIFCSIIFVKCSLML